MYNGLIYHMPIIGRFHYGKRFCIGNYDVCMRHIEYIYVDIKSAPGAPGQTKISSIKTG